MFGSFTVVCWFFVASWFVGSGLFVRWILVACIVCSSTLLLGGFFLGLMLVLCLLVKGVFSICSLLLSLGCWLVCCAL